MSANFKESFYNLPNLSELRLCNQQPSLVYNRYYDNIIDNVPHIHVRYSFFDFSTLNRFY
jgi:hypothetical protein